MDRNHQTTQKRLDTISSSLADARERLARIEGHLGIGYPQQKPAEADGADSDAA